MSNMRNFFFLSFSLLLLVSCGKSEVGHVESEIKTINLTKAQQEYVKAGNALAFKVYRSHSDDGTTVFAPFSIENMLGIAANAVETAEEKRTVCKVLDYGTDDVDAVNEHLCNLGHQLNGLTDDVAYACHNIVLTRGNNMDLERVLENYYSAKIARVDFGSDSVENLLWLDEWVKESTDGQVDRILQHSSNWSEWIAFNASYFDGKWMHPFQPELTKTQPFRLTNGGSMPLDMMSQLLYCDYFENAGYQVVRLPYGMGEFCMTVILPSDFEDFGFLSKNMDENVWLAIESGLAPCSVDIRLPRFSIRKEYLLNLVNSEWTSSPVMMSDEWYSAGISVSENGTTASSATMGGLIYETSPALDIKSFVANRPFIFVISEQSSGAILFIGQFCGD